MPHYSPYYVYDSLADKYFEGYNSDHTSFGFPADHWNPLFLGPAIRGSSELGWSSCPRAITRRPEPIFPTTSDLSSEKYSLYDQANELSLLDDHKLETMLKSLNINCQSSTSFRRSVGQQTDDDNSNSRHQTNVRNLICPTENGRLWMNNNRRSVTKLPVTKSQQRSKNDYCVFCKNNGELACTYRSHVLRHQNDMIECPVLRKYKCPVCGYKGGDWAHTIKYCPLNKGNYFSTIQALQTPRTSVGKQRNMMRRKL